MGTDLEAEEGVITTIGTIMAEVTTIMVTGVMAKIITTVTEATSKAMVDQTIETPTITEAEAIAVMSIS